MKRITTTLFVALFTTCFSAFAGGGWADCAVNITKDGGASYLYSLGNETWGDGDWVINTAFDGLNLGTPTSLVLNGALGDGWTDDSPGYTATSFVLYYRVYKSTATPGSWSQIALDNVNLKNGNNYVYDKITANINILALATLSGTNTYILEVAMSKNQYYTGGNWNSMIPGGQAIAYDNTVAGYKATFTKSITTGVQTVTLNAKVYSGKNQVEARFNGTAQVELYTTAGLLLNKTSATNQYSQTVKPGAYLLRINGDTHKVLVD